MPCWHVIPYGQWLISFIKHTNDLVWWHIHWHGSFDIGVKIIHISWIHCIWISNDLMEFIVVLCILNFIFYLTIWNYEFVLNFFICIICIRIPIIYFLTSFFLIPYYSFPLQVPGSRILYKYLDIDNPYMD